MSVLRELLTSIAVEAANRIVRSQTGEFGTVERLAGQLGRSVHERRGDAAILHFSDPTAGIRKVYVRPARAVRPRS
ncbi:hypothetical protein R5W24_004114 [Gemmata sp. JC717]|uniref:hypothetical protein n=1 Tax=Gemmata algarum TaxID=2975278 RepID=UPI0021BBB0F0|nr:hypothetical protein [Gemmata algarum]MDY3554982.1 hypothetical protein [Gemmata algarum]